MDDEPGVKRYQLVLPRELYERVRIAAAERDVAVVHLIRAFIKIGLMALDAEHDPNAALILRVDGVERHLILV